MSCENNARVLTPKTENSYLRLIKALAEYATDGLTGKPSTDANAIEAALKSKSIHCPVGNKALAGYLEKAQQIPKTNKSTICSKPRFVEPETLSMLT